MKTKDSGKFTEFVCHLFVLLQIGLTVENTDVR